MSSAAQYQLHDLLYLMARLRDPDGGCPWDLQQDFASIVPHTLEEAYEVADTIEREDFAHLPSELGDLLFQVVYYSQLGHEQQMFDFSTVVHSITEKLVRRHPHVFPTGELYDTKQTASLNTEQIKERWEEIKQQERAEQAPVDQAVSVLDDIPLNLPALSRALKIQKRASNVGFDWNSLSPVLDKVEEELQEVRAAIASGEAAAISDELGDLLFATVNVARHLKVNPETALRAANIKFSQRFQYVEQQAQAQGMAISDCTEAQLDALWNLAKQRLRTPQHE
ncbi:nucleoside triphosphate pyrophosphohydrolase [Pseudomonas sp. C27(2019)]|uniref:nucleoside triphosphate pyrophosphohydrolase n=1 Tax=Pseudomonas sp. C27(2019) TaxID=2604941 RepID=UPI001248B2BA|nr:nucleoside triphosphate pyrophosphohydrolase [Pseudomonas sp. C27(2019)]QEY58437.1 nucleoside triphosphate pyrophosphohydrolase [Pseudomonas sp. C27(2019)]